MSRLILDLQMFLREHDFDPGALDGIDGPQTYDAWEAYKASVTPPVGGLDRIWDFLMNWEGTSYENDPDDRGGATKFGIDQRSHPDVDIRNLTEESAREIYQQEWDSQVPYFLRYPADVVFFNYCVNTGLSRAVKFLQEAAGVTADGILGPVTRAAVATKDPQEIASSMIDSADSFYIRLNRPKYQNGWLNRNNALREFIRNE
jgi:lysozyme family protein